MLKDTKKEIKHIDKFRVGWSRKYEEGLKRIEDKKKGDK